MRCSRKKKELFLISLHFSFAFFVAFCRSFNPASFLPPEYSTLFFYLTLFNGPWKVIRRTRLHAATLIATSPLDDLRHPGAGGGLLAEACPTLASSGSAAHQPPPSTGFPRQEHCSGLPFPSPGALPDPGIKPASPVSRTASGVAGGLFTAEPAGTSQTPWPFTSLLWPGAPYQTVLCFSSLGLKME